MGNFRQKNQTLLLMAYYQNKLVAADWIFGFGRHLAIFYQASSGECSDLNPNSLLVWEAIKWGKEHGYAISSSSIDGEQECEKMQLN